MYQITTTAATTQTIMYLLLINLRITQRRTPKSAAEANRVAIEFDLLNAAPMKPSAHIAHNKEATTLNIPTTIPTKSPLCLIDVPNVDRTPIAHKTPPIPNMIISIGSQGDWLS